MIIRSYSNGFAVNDYTKEINIIPNQWGTIGQLGIFQEEPVTQHVVVFEEVNFNGGLIVDRVRGERANVNGGHARKIHSFPVPHFPLDDLISPQDVQGQRAYPTGNTGDALVETLDLVRARKIARIRMNHAWTLEYARAQAITAGTVYAPNGTVVQNWNTEFGITRTSVDFLLGTSTTEILDKINTCIAAIQDGATGATVTGTVVLTSPEFFARLIAHPAVKTAYQYYTSTQEPLRQRMTAGGGDLANGQAQQTLAMNRQFVYGGTTFIEYRGSYNGSRLIPASTAFMVPLGTDAFRTYFSPANRFGLVNTMGEQVYLFETENLSGTQIDLQSESNFVNALLRPGLIVNITSSN